MVAGNAGQIEEVRTGVAEQPARLLNTVGAFTFNTEYPNKWNEAFKSAAIIIVYVYIAIT